MATRSPCPHPELTTFALVGLFVLTLAGLALLLGGSCFPK